MKHYHEEVADMHTKHDGGKMPMKHHHEDMKAREKEHDGATHDFKHFHEEVAKMCGGGMAKKAK